MKFSTVVSDLQKAFNTIGGVIPTRSTLPILENFLLQMASDTLTITATNLDTSMIIKLKVKGTEEGKITVPAKRLIETIRSLPQTDISFTTDDNNNIIMSTSNGEYKLTGESSDNYPTISTVEGTDEIRIENDILKRLIDKTCFAVSTDELRPAMMGIFFQIMKKEIRAISTDGHRLVRIINSSFSSNNIEKDVVIPSKALTLVLRSINNGTSSMSFSENHAVFNLDNSKLISRLIEEKYPSYESVIPLDNDKKLVVDKNQILASVRRTSLYASSTTHQVRFSLKKGMIIISAEDIDFGSRAQETLSCEYTSEPMEIGFNSSYVIDILSNIDTDEVIFMFSSPTRACIVQPITQKDGEDLIMLVMPVRLNA